MKNPHKIGFYIRMMKNPYKGKTTIKIMKNPYKIVSSQEIHLKKKKIKVQLGDL